jgi:hypothetical protein
VNPVKHRDTYLWCAVPAALAVIWVFAVYLPVSAKITAKERELVSVRQESQRIDATIKTMAEWKKKGEESKHSVEQFEAEIPVVDQLPDFMRALTITAQKHHVAVTTLDNVLPSLDAGEDLPLVSSVFEIEVKGRFLDMGRFVEDLQGRKAFKEMLSARISNNDKEYPLLNGKFVTEFKAWKGKLNVEGK